MEQDFAEQLLRNTTVKSDTEILFSRRASKPLNVITGLRPRLLENQGSFPAGVYFSLFIIQPRLALNSVPQRTFLGTPHLCESNGKNMQLTHLPAIISEG